MDAGLIPNVRRGVRAPPCVPRRREREKRPTGAGERRANVKHSLIGQKVPLRDVGDVKSLRVHGLQLRERRLSSCGYVRLCLGCTMVLCCWYY